jgi:TP901 family phage tail tape measure protein
MASTYEYIISLQDNISGKLQKISGTSYEAVESFVKLQEKTDKLRGITGDFGNSIYSLRSKIDLLRSERDLIDPANLTKIRQYNSEIKALDKQITKLETINGSKFKSWTKDAFAQLPGFATNPLVLAGTASFAAGKMAMGWEEGMAKVNATAQLSQGELNDLGRTIKKLGIDAGADLARVPDAYEKILSQTNDVGLSMQILDKALKASKAGFTEVDTVAAAMAQTLSIVGTKNTNAAEVIDTLFAAKRVGAGEFRDFAQYLPQLIASAKGVNVEFKETAGMFAYFTGKGFNAATASTLLQNSFSLLGRTEVTDNMKKLGVNVFDASGKIRPMVDIFKDLGDKLNGLSDKDKSAWLDNAGIKDMQAKQGFIALASDIEKLQEAISATSNSSGELDKAFENTRNSTQRLQEAWAKIQGIAISFGGAVSSILNPALTILSPILDSVAWVLNVVGKGFSYWVNALQTGNPYILGLTAAIGTLSLAYAMNVGWTKLMAFWDKHAISWKTIHITVTKGLIAVQAMLKSAFLTTPFGWIAAGVMAIAAGYMALRAKLDSVTVAQRTLEGVQKTAWSKIADQKVRLEALVKVVSDHTAAENDRKKALTELQKLYPEEFKHLTLQNALTGDAIKLKDQLIARMLQEAKVSAAREKLTDLAKQELDLNTDPSKTNPGLFKKAGNLILAQGNIGLQSVFNAQSQSNQLNKGLGLIKKQRAALEKYLKDNGATETSLDGSNDVVPSLTPTDNMTETASIINSGARPTNISISLGNLVENITIHSQSVNESMTEVKEQVVKTLLEVLNSANAVAYKGA